MTRTELGVVALTCAAVDDVTAWCLLAVVVGIVRATADQAATVVLSTLGFIAIMFSVVRPALARYLEGLGETQSSRGPIAFALVGLLLSALLTEAIGVHALFGAFLFGAVIPRDSRLARALTNSLEDVVTILLLPAFFAFAGMRTEIGTLAGSTAWIACLSITLVATLGKFGGTVVAARAGGVPWRVGAALGVLMNTRGLMELIVLNVGLDLGLITPAVFTMMVLMALATTLATSPIVRRLVPMSVGVPEQSRSLAV